MNLNNSRNEEMGYPQPISQPFSGPVFVIGVWRSGTSLLYALLNKHPQLGLFYEGDLLLLRPMFYLGRTRKNWLEKWEYWNAGVSRHGLDSFRPSTTIGSLASAAESAGREYCTKKGATVWGCKSPSYYNRLLTLARDFPTARFLVIWRDPEEICQSIIKAAASSRWFASSGMMCRALLACEMLKKQCDTLVSRRIPLHQIHYNQLVEDTEPTMRRICEFLDLPFVSAVTTLDGADRGAVFKGAHHSLVNGTQIISSRNEKQELPAELKTKIGRYTALWKDKFGEDWLLCRYLSHVPEKPPGKWEMARDRILFWLLRIKDAASTLAYSLLPLRLWRLYRGIKYRNPDFIQHHNRGAIDQPRAKKTQSYVAKQGT